MAQDAGGGAIPRRAQPLGHELRELRVLLEYVPTRMIVLALIVDAIVLAWLTHAG